MHKWVMKSSFIIFHVEGPGSTLIKTYSNYVSISRSKVDVYDVWALLNLSQSVNYVEGFVACTCQALKKECICNRLRFGNPSNYNFYGMENAN